MKKKNEKLIAELLCSFDKNRNGITFHGDKSARITLDTDGSQLADNAKLLLLLGKESTFIVRFYEQEETHPKAKQKPIGQTAVFPNGRGTTGKDQSVF